MADVTVAMTVVLEVKGTAVAQAIHDAVIEELRRTIGKVAAHTPGGSPVELVSVSSTTLKAL